jgi:hypothetical protein
MTYTLTENPNTIIRDEDGAFIPADPRNLDYQAYLAWLEEGNEPNPIPPKIMPPIVPEPSDKEVATIILTDHEQRIKDLEDQIQYLTTQMDTLTDVVNRRR